MGVDLNIWANHELKFNSYKPIELELYELFPNNISAKSAWYFDEIKEK